MNSISLNKIKRYSIVKGGFEDPQRLGVEAGVGFLYLVFRINCVYLLIDIDRSSEQRLFDYIES